MNKDLLQLYAVTDGQWLKAGETLADAVEAAIKGGATLVQLREKHMEDEAFIREGGGSEKSDGCLWDSVDY